MAGNEQFYIASILEMSGPQLLEPISWVHKKAKQAMVCSVKIPVFIILNGQIESTAYFVMGISQVSYCVYFFHLLHCFSLRVVHVPCLVL